jgi:hypothetical protein
MPKVRKFTIVVRGDTESAYEEALSEATRLVNEGCLSGGNSSDAGGFYFDSTDEVPAGDVPA